MDVEKTIGFLLQQAAAHDARMAAHHEQFMAEMAEMRRDQEERWARADREDERLRRRLDRAIRLSVEEHRRERVRRREVEAKVDAGTARLEAAMAELAAAQADTQKNLQLFMQSLNPPRNGHE